MGIGVSKLYCGLSCVEINGLTEDQAKHGIRYLQEMKLGEDDKVYDDLMFYHCKRSKNYKFDEYCRIVDMDVEYFIKIALGDGSYGAVSDCWFAGKNVADMYIKFRDRNKRLDHIAAEVVKVIKDCS